MTPAHFWLAVTAALLASIAAGHVLERIARPCCDVWLDAERRVRVRRSVAVGAWIHICQQHHQFLDARADHGVYYCIEEKY